MNQSDEHDELWSLLKKARPPVVSPFFARNVLREIRTQPQESVGFWAALRRNWRLAGLTAAACCLTLTVALPLRNDDAHARQIDSLVAMAEQVSESPDFYVINDLEDLIASEESSVWLDNSAR